MKDERERYVHCPLCNKKVVNTRLTCSEHICSSCGAKFTALASKDFVTTILHAKDDNLTIPERVNQYKQKLEALTE